MDEISWAFYRNYGASNVWWDTHWLGAHVVKCPFDLWMYQEILFRTRPDVIIETGTFFGGSALYMASLCDLLGNGRVITIDTPFSLVLTFAVFGAGSNRREQKKTALERGSRAMRPVGFEPTTPGLKVRSSDP